MNIKKLISNLSFLRNFLFPIFSRFDFKFTWKHDVTKRKLLIKFWTHKGYWFYGKNRDIDEIKYLFNLVKKGDCVLEVGAHVGYLTQIFENIVGVEGSVYAIEPTPKNREFLEENTYQSTIVLPFAISRRLGEIDFFVEDFGGFTNSIQYDFVLNANKSKMQKSKNKSIKKIKVMTKTLDKLCDDFNIKPNFIKIDVEGAELSVIEGGSNLFSKNNSLMVEISQDAKEIYKFLYNKGFKAFKSNGDELKNNEYSHGNIFFRK